jgi:hypothetical protein
VGDGGARDARRLKRTARAGWSFVWDEAGGATAVSLSQNGNRMEELFWSSRLKTELFYKLCKIRLVS